MSVTLTVRDETIHGEISYEKCLEFPAERITIRELIRERVYQEVHDFNLAQGETSFHGLVQTAEAEENLSRSRSNRPTKTKREIDWKDEFERTIEAFQKNQFFVLVDNAQADSLDEEFSISPKTDVSFFKLTMLAGG